MQPAPASPEVMRGASIGACSAAVTIAAHGVADGALPAGPALVLLGILAAAVGAAAAGLRPQTRGRQLIALTAVMGLGQAGGHVALTAAGQHQHAAGPVLPMLMAHLAAAVMCAVLTVLAEQLHRVVASVLSGLDFVTAPPVSQARSAFRTTPSDRFRIALLACGRGLRGPPVAGSPLF